MSLEGFLRTTARGLLNCNDYTLLGIIFRLHCFDDRNESTSACGSTVDPLLSQSYSLFLLLQNDPIIMSFVFSFANHHHNKDQQHNNDVDNDASAASTSSNEASTCRQRRVFCVLQSSIQGCEYERDDVAANVECHLRRAGYTADEIVVKNVVLESHNYAQTLIGLVSQQQQRQQQQQEPPIECFINLCDGAWDEPSCGKAVVEILEEHLNVPYTGANVQFYEPTREAMKKAALSVGVRVPAWKFVHDSQQLATFLQSLDDDTSNNSQSLSFPMLVKHFSSYSSIGLTKDSKVTNVTDLQKQCEIMIAKFGGCLIEEYIAGREFTVLVGHVPDHNTKNGIRVKAYDPIECQFATNEEFKHYQLKWCDYDRISWVSVTVDDPQHPGLARALKNMAERVFTAIQGRGYGRIDVRANENGELYFLEINPNCGIFYPEGLYGSADFILESMDPQNAHAQFILDQVKIAKYFWNQRQPIFESRYDHTNKSWGIYAVRDIEEDEIIQNNEEQPVCLVTKAHILKHWMTTTRNNGGDNCIKTMDNFAAYCWPVSDNTFAMWKPNPEDWNPINHSCDPNAWFAFGNSLNLVAKRFIPKGEEITMEYATMVGTFPDLEEFDCHCGSRECREHITGYDMYQYPHLARTYQNHTTDYVAMKWRQYQPKTKEEWDDDILHGRMMRTRETATEQEDDDFSMATVASKKHQLH
jgi:D-alanine-D-alanine ligase